MNKTLKNAIDEMNAIFKPQRSTHLSVSNQGTTTVASEATKTLVIDQIEGLE